ncbi:MULTISPECIES: signal peptidase II [unclassified Fusibacter]|uniref:signal peptidase II n=1 Tax=unclassified Fusibacter TaxID=2624464 RepID=UPI001010F9A3|nr:MULTISPECIES: signal peptidase II [unclassified Fusibacter]MCK8059471.1 signal peptidase II [Fusibacter sp. A2]NPE21065.1 signal peptidase II [Fusibacter sp. A1]RXV62339.1 signal peptidase II [Fusibacter sp. A1]
MLLYTAIIILAVILDQLTKWLVVSYVKPIGSLPIIKDVFHLTYTENTGAAFSILSNKQSFLVIVTAIAMAIMFVYLVKWSQSPDEVMSKVAFAMMLGGGIGNLIDRARIDFVVDFLDARFINFAIFNVADMFIVVGCALFALSIILKK